MPLAPVTAAMWLSVAAAACLVPSAHASCVEPTVFMALTVEGDEIHATGPITLGSAAWLASLIAANHPHSVVLDSSGGDVREAVAMADIIRLARLDVSVPRLCSSACFMLFAAGTVRTVGLTSSIGVHRARSCDEPDSQLGTDIEADESRELGATPEILRLMEATYQPSIAYLTRADLAPMGVRFVP